MNPNDSSTVDEPDNPFGELDEECGDAPDEEEVPTGSVLSSGDVYDSAVEGLLEVVDMGSLSEAPTPQTVTPEE